MKNILIIDDDRDLSELIHAALTAQGYQVNVAHDPKEGIKTAKHQKPNLILMDVMLPGMNGGEAIKLLKADPGTKDIPVIFLTGLVSKQELQTEYPSITVEGRQYRTIGKPFDLKELLDEIKKHA